MSPRPGRGSVVRRLFGRPCSADDGDSGMATILVLSLVSVIVVASSVAVAIAQVSLVRQRVASAADLAALAAATALRRGEQAGACREAAAVAAANHGVLLSCRADYPSATVEVGSAVPGLVSRLAELARVPEQMIRVRARAGPPAMR